MPTLSAGLMACICAAISSFAIASEASAQQFSGPMPLQGGVSQTMTGGDGYSNNTNTSGAPMFQIPNFTGDRRVADLYYYMHPVEREQWDVYQKRLREAAGRLVNLQPTQHSPTAADANGSPGNVMTGIQTAALAAGSVMNNQGSAEIDAAQNSTAGSAVTTSVRGEVIPGQDF